MVGKYLTHIPFNVANMQIVSSKNNSLKQVSLANAIFFSMAKDKTH
jgi:hypothetical protein